jgi:hypothetical protein
MYRQSISSTIISASVAAITIATVITSFQVAVVNSMVVATAMVSDAISRAPV